jgi:hypothetical protein
VRAENRLTVMPSFSGKFQYLNTDGATAQAGACQVSFDKQTLTLGPASGAPLVFDLGDVDVFAPSDYELTLTLYTGKEILLHQFGKAFQNLSHDLLEAYRQRLLRCLLLEDLEEVSRFEGFAQLESPARTFSSPAEFRIFKSILAVLPNGATGFQWRLADNDAVAFDEGQYAVRLESAGQQLTATRLAKRTREFSQALQEAISQLAEKSAQTVHALFPFLNPDQLQQAAMLMKEGHAVPLAKLRAVHSKTEQALQENVVDAQLKPYFQTLLGYTAPGWLFAGFKILRKEEGPEEMGEQPEKSSEADEADAELQREGSSIALSAEPAADLVPAKEEVEPILHWFFFPLAAKVGAPRPDNLVAWEAASKSGRATNFFRLVPPDQAREFADPAKAPALVANAIRELNHAIVLLNFRREPIYLPDDSLTLQPHYHRYPIACRKIPQLTRLRASFLGRAIHTSPAAWQKQFETFLARA